jgi:chloramphenicol-sensitive protein RarD
MSCLVQLDQTPVTDSAHSTDTRDGLIAAFIAYFMWGVLPAYFKVVGDVAAVEVLVHRVVWAVPFGAVIIIWRRQWPEVRRALGDARVLGFLAVAAVVIGGNWFVYIWAVQNDQIFQASLGYYINPLLFTLAGVLLFGEKLRTFQIVAVSLAAAGVLILTLSRGQIPVIALTLGTLFTIYGVIRKRIVVGAMPGLFVETLMLLPLSVAYLVWIMSSGVASFAPDDSAMMGILVLAGPVTVLPLLCFAIAARRLSLSTVGFMQFIAPTLQFMLGLFYGEVLTRAHAVCFGLIWIAVAVFSWDALRASRRGASVVAQIT